MRSYGLILLAVGFSAGVAAGLATAQETIAPVKPVAPPKTVVTTAPPPPAAVVPASPPSPPTPQPQTYVAPSEDAAPAKVVSPKAPEAPKPPPEPLKRPRFNAAILQGVDKITAETLRFEAKVGEPVRYKGLILTVRACETTAGDEDITDSVAYTEVQSQPEVLPGRVAAPPRQVFKGWMFASSPTLHPFEHPVYDLWLIACKTAAPGA